MRIHYATLISEREADLQALGHQQRGQRPADRVRFLRLLKSEQVHTIQACVPILGYSRAQLSRWWARYRAGGLQALLAELPHPGSQGQMTAEAWADLEEAMKQGHIATLEQSPAVSRTALGDSLPKCQWSLVAPGPAACQAQNGPPSAPPRRSSTAGGI